MQIIAEKLLIVNCELLIVNGDCALRAIFKPPSAEKPNGF
jgi:hypothetical protein